MAEADSLLSRPADLEARWGTRRLAVFGLVGGLLLLGIFDEPVFAALNRGWQAVLSALGLNGLAAALQSNLDPAVTRRTLLSGLSYAALYVGLCLLLLRLLLPRPGHWRLALRVYAGVLLAYLLLLGLGKAGGDLRWAYRLSRHLLDFLVSPLPVLGLVVLLRGARLPAAGEEQL